MLLFSFRLQLVLRRLLKEFFDFIFVSKLLWLLVFGNFIKVFKLLATVRLRCVASIGF